MQRVIAMHARLRQTDGQTDEHHGNSATIRSNERVARWKEMKWETKKKLLTTWTSKAAASDPDCDPAVRVGLISVNTRKFVWSILVEVSKSCDKCSNMIFSRSATGGFSLCPVKSCKEKSTGAFFITLFTCLHSQTHFVFERINIRALQCIHLWRLVTIFPLKDLVFPQNLCQARRRLVLLGPVCLGYRSHLFAAK